MDTSTLSGQRSEWDEDFERLNKERAEHQGHVDRIDQLIQALAMVRDWKLRGTVPELAPPDSPVLRLEPTPQVPASRLAPSSRQLLSPSRFKGLSQAEALVEIAKENDGILRITDARDIFIEAKLARGKPRNVPGHIHHLLRNLEQFKHVGPGVFRLKQQTDHDVANNGSKQGAHNGPLFAEVSNDIAEDDHL